MFSISAVRKRVGYVFLVGLAFTGCKPSNPPNNTAGAPGSIPAMVAPSTVLTFQCVPLALSFSSPTPDAQTLTWSQLGSGEIFSDSGCSNQESSILISAGTSSLNFYFLDDQVENLHPAFSVGGQALSVAINVTANPGGGPIDGTYTATGIRCNGSAATGNLKLPDPPTLDTFVIANSSGSLVTTTGSCTMTLPVNYSYTGNTIEITQTATSYTCIPSNCSTVCSGTITSSYSQTFEFSKNGNGLTLTGSPSNSSCSNSTPAQVDPIGITMTAAVIPALSYAGATGTAGSVGDPMQVKPTSLNNGGGPIIGCSVTSGSLPANLSVDPVTCVISGAPASSGTFSVTIKAKNPVGSSAGAALTLTVTSGGSTPIAPTLSYGSNTAYGCGSTNTSCAVTITPVSLSNGGAPITACAVSTGSLPTGVGVDATTCVISGNATQSGNFHATVVATNRAGSSAPASVTLSTALGNPTSPLLSYANATGTISTLGGLMNVSPTLLQDGGSPITGCSVTTGSLPDGLSVNPHTCVISGNPKQIGPFEAWIVATNAVGSSAPGVVSLSVGPPIAFQGYSTSHWSQTQAGDTLVVLVAAAVNSPNVPPTALQIEDTAGNTFTQALGPVSIANENFTSGAEIVGYLFYSINIKGAPYPTGDDISIVGSTSWSAGWVNASPWISSYEFSGITKADFAVSAKGHGTSIISATGAATEVGELLFAVALADAPYATGSTPLSEGTGFGQLNYGFTKSGDFFTEMGSAQITGPQKATFTADTPSNWAAFLIGFKF